MSKPNISKIREALTANRGGLKLASDGQIMTIWHSLNKQTQEQYLDALEARDNKKPVKGGPQPHVKGAKDAVSNTSRRDV